MPPGDWKWLALALIFVAIWWFLRPRNNWLDEKRVDAAIGLAGYLALYFVLPVVGVFVLVWGLGAYLGG